MVGELGKYTDYIDIYTNLRNSIKGRRVGAYPIFKDDIVKR